MSKSPLSLVLRSALIAGGAVIGLCHAVRPVQESEAEGLDSGAKAHPPQGVTHRELAEALDRVSAALRREVDERLTAQDTAIEALREMSAHTSHMIERLLERMDSEAEFADFAGNSPSRLFEVPVSLRH